jgi:hypothetical protein
MAFSLSLTASELRDLSVPYVDGTNDMYLKITQATYNYQPEDLGGMTVVNFGLWRSKTERDQNLPALKTFNLNFTGTNRSLTEDLFAYCYSVAKDVGEISGLSLVGAVDV